MRLICQVGPGRPGDRAIGAEPTLTSRLESRSVEELVKRGTVSPQSAAQRPLVKREEPRILDKSYSITAEVTIPKGGAEGVIVTEGGRAGLGKGGTGVLYVDGTVDVGADTRTGVAMLEYRYDSPFRFTGKIDKLTFKLEPEHGAAAENLQSR